MKRQSHERSDRCTPRFPQHYAAASLKLVPSNERLRQGVQFSAALRCGLIEASVTTIAPCTFIGRFPQHYAAASLKLTRGVKAGLESLSFPQHYAAASLKRRVIMSTTQGCGSFSAALRCGLIEASLGAMVSTAWRRSFPQHYAAASLKRGVSHTTFDTLAQFSAALRCGLIEARKGWIGNPSLPRGFPQHYAAASLKPAGFRRAWFAHGRFPQHYAAASLKQQIIRPRWRLAPRFPQHYAAASLKLVPPAERRRNAMPVFRSITLRPH